MLIVFILEGFCSGNVRFFFSQAKSLSEISYLLLTKIKLAALSLIGLFIFQFYQSSEKDINVANDSYQVNPSFAKQVDPS